MVRHRAAFALATLALSCSGVPPLARADDRELAVQQAREARAAYDRRDFEVAAHAYEDSLRLAPRAAAAMSAALAWDAANEAARAADDYAYALRFRELEPADAERAQKRLVEIERAVAVLDVSAPPEARITILGVLEGAVPPTHVHVRPGGYVVQAKSPSVGVDTAHVDVVAGETSRIAFERAPANHPAASSGLRTGGWVAVGAGITLGAAAGILAAGTLEERNTLCPSLCSSGGARSTVENWRTAYEVSLGAAAVGMGVGIVLLVLAPPSGRGSSLVGRPSMRPAWGITF